MDDPSERNTVPLFDEKRRHIGYYHKPTGQVTTPNGSWSEPTFEFRLFTIGNRAHAERLRACDRLGLKTNAIAVAPRRAAA